MADRKIDEAKANAWLKEVKEEIQSVEKVLKEVPSVTADVPGGEDTFIKMLEATNSYMTSAWDKATEGFESAWQKVDDVLKEIGKTGKIVASEFENFDKRAKR